LTNLSGSVNTGVRGVSRAISPFLGGHRAVSIFSETKLFIVAMESYILAKEPYILAKKPYILAKEPHILAKEPYILAKEPHVLVSFEIDDRMRMH